jgi:hypothetical protein
MEMNKKIVVINCRGCNRLQLRWNKEIKGYTDYVCRPLNKTTDSAKIITNLSEIPEWCPLPDDV